MNKFITFGVVIGLLIGIIAYFIFPRLANFELSFNQQFNERVGNPTNYYSPKSGSIYAVGTLFPILFGFIGGLSGYFVFKILKSKKS